MLTISGISIDHIRARNGFIKCATDSPIISWAARSNKAGDTQAAYRLAVGDWDSGWVESAENSARVPAGVLEPGVVEDIALALRSAAGDESEIYEHMIVDARIDWDAPWISAPAPQRDRPIYFRKTFNLPSAPIAARVYACGIGYQYVAINGEHLSDICLDPAHTDYSKRLMYTFEPSDSFVRGKNEIKVIVAPGWRDNTAIHALGHTEKYSFEGPLQLSMIVEILLKNGKTMRIITDDTWEAGAGPITYANLFNGQIYDANVDEKYGKAVAVPAPGGKMEPMLIPHIEFMEVLTPVAAWPDGENAVILDYGRNIAGYIVPYWAGDVPMEKGHRLIFTHSEELNEDGTLFRDTLRSDDIARDIFIASGDPEKDADALYMLCAQVFTYHGFRYARIEGIDFSFDTSRIRAIAMRTNLDIKSSFTCGDPLISKINEICVNTERANMHSILTDCPQRNERLGWMNDATVRFEETPYNFDISAIFPKIIHDLMDAQGEDGAITCTAPFVWGNRPADPVCSSFLVAGYEAAMHTGNMDIIKEAFPAFAAWEQCLLAHSDDYIVNYSYYGDWAGPADCCVPGNGVDPGAPSAVTPGIFMSTGYSYLNCKLLAKFANWLGDAEAEAKYAELGEKVKAAILDKWYDAETGDFASGSQACLAFALWLGIAPEPARTAARLDKAVHDAGDRLTTGNLCSRYIMDALTDNGYLETAWTLMTRDEYPSIGYMIQQEATTVWERFELMKAPGMNSHNHPMYGAVDYWNYAYLAGVKCAAPGWKKFTVKPYLPEKLLSAQATIDTVMGPISVRWTKRYGGKHLHLTVPFGAEAEIDFCGVKKVVGSGFHTITVEE